MNASTAPAFSKAGIAFEVVEQGTIRIGGRRVHRPGEQATMSDQFDITTLEQREGEWMEHPVAGSIQPDGNGSRRVIPITIPYDDPDLVIQSKLTAYDQTARRVVCRGTTEGCARRRTGASVIDVTCVGPDDCTFAASPGIACKWFGRMRVHIDVPGQSTDPTHVFVLRSAGYNTLRGVEASLRQYHALFGQRLRGIKFKLTLRTATSATSEWEPYEFIELSLNEASLGAAAAAAKLLVEEEASIGLDQAALELAVRAGVANSEFSRSSLEGVLAAEFFPVQEAHPPQASGQNQVALALSEVDLQIPSR